MDKESSASGARVLTPLETVRVLAQEIGPRGSTSRAERLACDWVAAKLQRLGYTVQVEPFRAPASFSYAYGIFFSCFAVAPLVYLVSPVGAALFCLIALVLFALETSSVETVSRLLPKGPSQNVVGILKPSHPKRTLILTAHLDSARSALLWHPAIVPYFHSIFLVLAAAMVIETLLYGIGLLTGASLGGAAWVWWVSLVPAALLAVAVLILVDREVRYAHTRGANDNASGVAVMLAAADRLARGRLKETELWIVGTGCEESGPFGIARFLQSHSFAKENTFFLNFDNIGAGCISYVTGEGILLTLKADAHLVEIARRVASRHPAIGAQPILYKTLPTDNTIALLKGQRGMSLMAFDARGLLPHWHWRTDTIENIDAGTLRCATQFAVEIARDLDAASAK